MNNDSLRQYQSDANAEALRAKAIATADRLATLTAEQVCAKMYDDLWKSVAGLTRAKMRTSAQRHLDAIRALCAASSDRSAS